MYSKTFVAVAFAAALLAPSFVFAQSATTGLLNVYVQVLNQNGYQNQTPNNFNVAVSGTSPSPATFQGSQSGTLVSVGVGSYSVTVTNASGFTPNYSVGCNGTISASNSQTCVITVSTSAYNTYLYPQAYPYPYQTTPALTCRTDTPTVALGQTARFSAVGGAGGTYNWTTASQNYPNVGPVLTTTFQSSGSQTVTVTNAAQTATCAVQVSNSYYPTPYATGYNTPSYVYPYQAPTNPVLSSYVYPRFPNTGLEPIESAQIAFAVVLLLAAGIAVFPYGRKVLAFTLR